MRDAALRQQLQGIAQRYPRYGYRRAWALVRADGEAINIKRVHRVWRQAGLHVPQRQRRRRIRGTGLRPVAPTQPNSVWAYDFIHDRCANGQKLKLLTVVDEWTRECLAIRLDGRITAQQVIAVLDELIQQQGPPMDIRSDTGPECSARAVKAWLAQKGIQTAYIDAGKPWQHGTNESVGGTLRDACLNLEWFRHRTEARMVIEQWRRHSQ
jgi:putative transposase